MRLPSYQDLSKEQDRINDLPADGRHLVIGPPGTGKTVMALYRASMLKKRRRKALLLMYSRLLMQYTESAAADLLLDGQVTTFYSWFSTFYRRNYGTSAPEMAPYVYDFAHILAQVNASPPRSQHITDLLVDEGQDLPREFYMLTPMVAPNVTVFADDNQRLTDNNSTVDQIKSYGRFGEIHKLTRNYRNTREIATLAAEFYTGLKSGVPSLPTRQGEHPTLRRFSGRKDFVDYLLRYERNNPERTIGVASPTAKGRDRIVRLLSDQTVNPVQHYVGGQGANAQKVDFERPGIVVVHYKSAKGLEFDTLFLPDLDEYASSLDTPETRMTFYVLLSRAREELHLSYAGATKPRIAEMFPPHLVEEL